MLNADEAVHLIERIESGENIILSPVQCLEMAILLYNMKDNRWTDSIRMLWIMIDDLQCFDPNGVDFIGQSGFEEIEKHLKNNVEKTYKTGSLYKKFNDDETLERMKLNGKIK